MAYGVKYRFPFESVDGVSWTIDILKNGYSGSILTRAMGGAPALRKDQNGCIHGTSLDLIAECAVDGEFQELSTSDPFAFQVKVYHGEGTFAHLVWQGYVTPEIYNAPEIAPPYDVNITATDGLGELKQHYYAPQGSVTVAWLLSSLLSYTGLSLSVKMVSDLHPNGESLDVGVWSGVRINLDYMSGETCYDVLQAVLASMHASITQAESAWAIIKETGMTVEVANSLIRYPGSGSSFTIDIPRFGQLSAHQGGFWPVGQMTREYVAPKKKIVLTSANHYRSDLASGSWTVDGQASYESSYYSLPQSGSQISKTISFSHEIRKHLMLSVKVRNVGEGSNVGTLVVYVKLTGHSYGGTVFYLVNGTGNRRREAMDVTWSPSSGTCSFEVQAPMESDTDQDYVTLDILLPLYNNSARYYMGATSLDITIANGDSTYPKRVYGIDLYQYEQTAGFQKIVNIDNGARGEAPGVDMSVACLQGSNAYVGIEQMQYGVLMDSDYEKISAWDTNAFSNKDYFDLLARDYALSYASARVRMSGILNTDPEWNAIPVMFIDDHDNVPYLVESLSWDLRNDEITVQMLSLPASSISVDSEGLEEGVTDNSTGHTQGNPSSGGGGGGGTGTVTSVGVSVPSGMTVSGSPVTSSGTIQIGLETGNSIHGHSNKNTLDNISAQDVQHWEVGYQYAHGHNNKTVLDGITSQKVSQWDAGSSLSVAVSNLLSQGFQIGTITINNTDYTVLIPPPIVEISGASTAPKVKVTMGQGNYDEVALPVAGSSQAGIVSTGAQTFGGTKTFDTIKVDRIYIGPSAYLEWDSSAGAVKLVGNFYATGNVAAGD